MTKKYEIIIGGITIKEDGDDWFDAGRVRYCLGEEDKHAVLAIQAVYADHAEEIAQAMDGLVEDLQKLGIASQADNPKVIEGIPVIDAILGENPTESRKRRKGRGKRRD